MVGLAKGDMFVYNSFSHHTQFDALMDHVELRQKQFHISIRRYCYYDSTVGGSTIVVNNERV